jgi:hypothetical protein
VVPNLRRNAPFLQTKDAAHPLGARNPEGLIGILKLAAEMKPDALLSISDGSFQWSPGGKQGNLPWNDLHKLLKDTMQQGGSCKVNFITFQAKPNDLKEPAVSLPAPPARCRK